MTGVSGVSGPKVDPKTILLDEVTEDTTYVGRAAPGSDTSAAVWQVFRLQTTGSLLAVQYADGQPLFNRIWDARAGYSYS